MSAKPKKTELQRLQAKAKRERHESKFAMLWKTRNMVPRIELVREYKFHPTRKWRFDFAHVATKTAIEIEGGTWSGGTYITATGIFLIRSSQRLFGELATLSEERRELAQQLIGARESTLREIARELHDEFGQLLTAIGSMLGRAGRQAPEGSALRADLRSVARAAIPGELTYGVFRPDRAPYETRLIVVGPEPNDLDNVATKVVRAPHAALPTLLATWANLLPDLAAGKCDIAVGGDADLVLLDPERTFTVHAADSPSAQGHTPFEGLELRGQVEQTWLRGQLIHQRGAPPGPPRGRYLHRS